MKACVLRENGVLEVAEVSPESTEGWIRVRVTCAGICGSDIGRAFRNGAYHYPLVMGHEFAGVVEHVPEGVTRFAPGDRVAIYPLLPCGSCESCRKGDIQLCLDYDYFGSRRDGGFAQYIEIPEANLIRVPDAVSLEEAALAEPAAVAHHAVYSHPVRPGSTALVIGGGPVGLLAAQWLRIRGCRDITVADIDPRKTAFAEEFGFTGVDSRQLSGAFDICVEACGLSVTRDAAIRCCARKGHIFLIGNPAEKWPLGKAEFSMILRKELSFSGSWNSLPDPDWIAVLNHAGKDLNLKKLITARHTLSEAPEVFRRLREGGTFQCKTLLFNEGEGGL